MKKSIYITSLTFMISLLIMLQNVQAQRVYLSDSSEIYFVGEAKITIVNANLENNGSFSDESGSLVFKGVETDSILGEGINKFNQLILDSLDQLIMASDSISIIQSLYNNDGTEIRIEDSKLEIRSDAILFIDSTGSIDTYGEDAKILLRSGSRYLNNGETSLLNKSLSSTQTSSSYNNPLLQIEQEISGPAGWRMLTCPVDTTFSHLFSGDFVTSGFPGSNYPDSMSNLYLWDESIGNTYFESYIKPSNITQTAPVGKGFFYYIFDGATTNMGSYSDSLPLTLSATGYENMMVNGHFDFDISYTPKAAADTANGDTIYFDPTIEAGWNLIGNPSASPINWDEPSGWIKQNIDNTIYVWDPSANDGNGEYLYWSSDSVTSTMESGIIPPFQAFWVKANSSTPGLTMKKQAKTTDSSRFYKSEESFIEKYHIKLILRANGMETESFITLSENGILGTDPSDIYRLEPLSDNWLACYTNSSLDQNAPLLNNSLPLYDENLYIPLFIDAMNNGESYGFDYTLEWELPYNWPSDLKVELMDHSEETAISMYNQYSYSGSIEAQSSGSTKSFDPMQLPSRVLNSREANTVKLKSSIDHPFAILISKGNASDEASYISPKPSLLDPYPSPFTDQLNIGFRLPSKSNVTIQILDLHGRLIDIPVQGEYEIGVHEINYTPSIEYYGVYLIRLITDTDVDTKKTIRLKRQ